MPSPTRKTAVPRLRRRWIFPAGAGVGLALALLTGALLGDQLQALRLLFVPFSALACGLTALGAWMHFASLTEPAGDTERRWRLRIALAVFALGAILLLGLYMGFARRSSYAGHTRGVTYLVGWSRSELCACSEDDATSLQEMMGLGIDVATCWKGLWAVELAMALGYLLTLGGAGVVAGLLMVPAAPPRAPGAPQPPPGYLDFDLWIDQRSAGLYRAKAWSGAGFEGTGTFALPPGLAGGELRLAGGGALRGGPAAGAADADTLEQVGDELFRTVFQGELLKAFQGCLAKARRGPGLRIRLRLNDVPQLAELPWEYLYDAEGQGFLALSARTPVVRYLELSEELGTLLVEPPLRVLAVISTPRGYRDLAEADEEWRRLGSALEPLRHGGLIEVERLERPTFEALEARPRGGPAGPRP